MMPPPGTRLLGLARAWFDEATVANVFEPLVADWQREWADAQTASAAQRGWILVAGLGAFLRTLLKCGGSDLLRAPDIRVVGRSFGVLALAAAALVALQFALSARQVFDMPLWPASPGAVLLMATVEHLPLALAVAMLPAMAWLHRAAPSPAARYVVLGLVAGTCLLVLVTGWLTPLAHRPVSRHAFIAYERHLDAEEAAGRLVTAHTMRRLRPRSLDDHLGWLTAQRSYQTLPGLMTLSRQDSSAGRSITTTLLLHRVAQIPALGLALGLFGWMLVAGPKAGARRIAVWWAIAAVTTLTFAGSLASLGANLTFSPWRMWIPVALFLSAATAMSTATGTRRGAHLQET